MDLQRLINAIIRKLWLVGVLSLTGTIIAGYFSIVLTRPMYQTETTMYIINRSSSVLSGNAINLQDLALSRQLISDYGNIITTRRVLEPALREINNNNLTVEAIGRAISVYLKKDSNVLTIAVTWPNPEEAAQITNAVSRSFSTQISRLTTNISIGNLDEALVPSYPIPSKKSRTIVVGFLAGMMIALGIVYVRELFDNTIYSATDIEQGLELKVIGIIPEHNIKA